MRGLIHEQLQTPINLTDPDTGAKKSPRTLRRRASVYVCWPDGDQGTGRMSDSSSSDPRTMWLLSALPTLVVLAARLGNAVG